MPEHDGLHSAECIKDGFPRVAHHPGHRLRRTAAIVKLGLLKLKDQALHPSRDRGGDFIRP